MYRKYSPSQRTAAAKRSNAASRATKSAIISAGSRQPMLITRGSRSAPSKPRRSRAFNLGGLGSALGGIAGTLLGGPAGSAIGSRLGGAASSLLGKITGLGDYKISYNTLAENSVKMLSGDAVPAVQNTHSGVRICHREYITDISSSVGFVNTTYPINPGVSTTFPWLSAVAQNFQQYKLHGMVFSFVSTSADALNSTNTALGTVIMATNYNASNNAFSNKQQMENNEFTTSSKPSQNIMHMIECDPKQTLQEGKFYIRTGALPVNQDIKTYDVGLFQLGTVGSQAAAVIGELHVSYDIELMKPENAGVLDNESGYCHLQMSGTIAASTPLGTNKVVIYDNIGTLHGSGGLSFSLGPDASPGQQFLVQVIWYGTSTASVVVPSITLTNCTQQTYYNADTATYASNTGSTSSILIDTFVLEVSSTATPNSQTNIAFSTGGTLPGGTLTGDIFISQIPAAGA